MTADMISGFQVPATLQAYLTEPAIRTGVDALLMVKPDRLPPDLGIDELGDYYAARAAAELTRYDWAIALHGLWSQIWGEAIDSHWVPVSTETLIANELSVTPFDCWDQEGFCVYHAHADLYLSTGVSFDADRTQISFSIDNEEEQVLLRELSPFKWSDENDEDWPEWLVFDFAKSPLDPQFRFDDLQEAARKAVDEANRLRR